MVGFQALAAMMAISFAFAHPGENAEAIKHEMEVRNAAHAYASRSLSQCQGSAQSVAMRKRTAARRAAKVQELRQKRSLTASKATS